MPVDYVAIDLSTIIAVGASTVGAQVSISSEGSGWFWASGRSSTKVDPI